MDSILQSIKKLLGIAADYNQFDTDIIIHINSVFAILKQLGVGPENGFAISGEYDIWSDFIPKENTQLQDVITYVYLKVKLIFDPPLSASVIESMKQTISELEWRLNVEAESQSYGEEEIQNG